MSGPDDLDPGPPDGGVWPRSDGGLARRDVLKSAGVLPLGTAIDADGLGKHSGAATADEARTVPALPDRFEGWQAGDLHVHTHYSHDVCGDPTTCEDPETVGFSVGQQIRNAETRGLDYLAITDHSTVAAIDDPDFESDEVTLLGAYEHSLAGGHAGFFGVDRVYDRASGTDGRLRALLDELHRDDGVGVINHPRTNISATWTYDGPAGMDAVEVWSIAWYLREELFGGVSSQNHEALSLYDAYLGAGHRLAAVGGSDNHWVHTSWAQGPGQPTTWVHAPGGDAGDIVDGIRHDRTFVSWDWTGPQLLLEAETDDGYDAMTGDVTAAAGPTDVRVTVANGAGHRLRLVLDGTVVAETVAPATPYTWETTVDVPERPDADERTGHNWLRAEALLEADYSMRALTSPIYFAHRGDPDTGGECACHPPAQRRQYSDLDL
jgi:hypothetical protein